jgi:putative transcriptional regulator
MPRIEAKLKIGNRLQQYRVARSITQQDLAEAIDVTRATIIAIEKGNYNPSLELAFRLAAFFSTKLEDLFYLGEDIHEWSDSYHSSLFGACISIRACLCSLERSSAESFRGAGHQFHNCNRSVGDSFLEPYPLVCRIERYNQKLWMT